MEQLKSLSCLTFICILLSFFVNGYADANNCGFQQLHNSISNKLRVHCDVNDMCTAVHCQGIFLKKIISSKLKTKENDTICFGAVINHCDVPLSVDVYLQYDAIHYTINKRLYNNITVLIYSHEYLFIELKHHKDSIPNSVSIKVSLKFGLLQHPLSYELVPECTYILPQCPANVTRMMTPQLELPVCHPPPPVSPHTGHPEHQEHHQQPQQHHQNEVIVETTTQNIQSETFGKPCDPKMVYSCQSKEICTFNNTCDCQPGLVINPNSGLCDEPGAKPKHAHLKRISTPQPHNESAYYLAANIGTSTDKSANSKSNSTLITGLSVGAAALLAIIILVAFIIWKRQATQNNHVPLIDNEEVVI